MEIVIDVKINKLNKIQNKLYEKVNKALFEIGLNIRSEAIKTCPSTTYRKYIFIEQRGLGWAVGWRQKVLTFLEYGTRPHMIYPREKMALYWKGALHPVKKVHHPGTKPQPFLRPAFEKTKPIMKQIIMRHINEN